MKKLLSTTLLAASFALSGIAHATPLFSTVVFGAGDSTVTLDEVALPDGTVVTTQFSAWGVTFGPGIRIAAQTFLPEGFSGEYLDNTGELAEAYSVFFNAPVDAAGAFWEFNENATGTLSAYLNGNLIESFSFLNLECCTAADFLGFQGIIFNELRLTSSVDTSFILDNIRFSNVDVAAVPEPLSAALFGIGALGIAAARRRKLRPQ